MQSLIRNLRKSVSIWVVWCSFISFLTLYVLQKGNGLVEMESPFFRGELDRAQVYQTNIWVNIIALVFILIAFCGMWLTKKRRELSALYGGWTEWIIVLVSLTLFVSKAYLSKPLEAWREHLEGALLLYVCLGILSIPSILFFLSWIREKTDSIAEEKLVTFLNGRAFLTFCAVFAAIGLGIDFYFTSSLDIWNDEGYTLRCIEQNWLDMLTWASSDVHPPFYLVIFKAFAYGIHHLVPAIPVISAAKIAATLPHLILAVICLTAVRKKWGNCVAGLGAISVVCMPHMMYHSQELRLYSWAMLWLTCSWLCAHSIWNTNRWRDWAGFTVFSLLTAYTCYAVCIAIAILWVLLAVQSYRRRCLKKWLISAASLVIAYLPWSLVMMRQMMDVEKWFWMPAIDYQIILDLLLSPTRDVLIMLIVIAAAVITLAEWRRNRTANKIYGLVGIALVFWVVLFMCGKSCIGTTIITARIRYVVPMLVCLWLGILVISKGWYRLQLLMALLILFASSSEMLSFIQIQSKGRREANLLHDFVTENPQTELVVSLTKSGDVYKISALRHITGDIGFHFLTSSLVPKQIKIPDNQEIIKHKIEIYYRNILPDCIYSHLPEVVHSTIYSYGWWLYREMYQPARQIDGHQIHELLASNKNVYCIAMVTQYDTPDLDATEELLGKYGIHFNRTPAFHANIDSGTHTLRLYKLEL